MQPPLSLIAAKAKAEAPYLSRELTSIPVARKGSMQRGLAALRIAYINAFRPLLFLGFASAPALSKMSIQLVYLLCTECINGVFPPLSDVLTFAPASTSRETALESPLRAAQERALRPLEST